MSDVGSTQNDLDLLVEKVENLKKLYEAVARNPLFTKEEVFSIEIDIKLLSEKVEETRFAMDMESDGRSSRKDFEERKRILNELFSRDEFENSQDMMSYFVEHQKMLEQQRK